MQYQSQVVIMGELISATVSPFTRGSGEGGQVMELVVRVARQNGDRSFVEDIPVSVFNRPDLHPVKGQQVVATGRVQMSAYNWTDPSTGEISPRSKLRLVGLSVVLVPPTAESKAAGKAKTQAAAAVQVA